MKIPYAAARAAIETLYSDSAVATHHNDMTEGGITRAVDEPGEPFACRWSTRDGADVLRAEGYQRAEYDSKLICAPECDVRLGDTIALTRQGVTRDYDAGEPALYETHQEVPLRRRTKA